MGTEVYMDSYMYSLIGNNLLPGAPDPDWVQTQKRLTSLKSFSLAVPVAGAHQSRTNQKPILETNSLLPSGPLLKQP